MLEESIFVFGYVRLYDVDILKEKLLNYLQTVETLIRRCVLFANYPYRGLQSSMG